MVGPQLGGRVARGEEVTDVPGGYCQIVILRAGLGGGGVGWGPGLRSTSPERRRRVLRAERARE